MINKGSVCLILKCQQLKRKIIIIRFAVRLLCSICRVSSNSDIILSQKQTNNI